MSASNGDKPLDGQLIITGATEMRSFSLVDHKVAEADFFLDKIAECGYDFFAVRCYVAAFVASARSITYSLQTALSSLPGFDAWYATREIVMRSDPLARFFHDFRRFNHHTGDNLVSAGSSAGDGRSYYWFQPTDDVHEVPQDDVESACRRYFTSLLELMFACYETFGPHIDAQQRYTPDVFASMGKTIEDAEEECGFPRGWTDIGDPSATAHRWQALRDSSPGCEINGIFQRYLGMTIPTMNSPP